MFYEQILEKAKSNRAAALANMKLEDHLVLQLSPGHTSVVCHMNRLHNVISTAVYYADKTALGQMEPEQGLAILQKLAAMQVNQPGAVSDGNFLWYAEETRAQDLNAAFFILMPMLKLRMTAPENITPEQLAVMDKMMQRALPWFSYYCSNAEFYYSNPTISNAACLYSIASLSGNSAKQEEAHIFLRRLFDYCGKRGWGWGESVSPSYIMEIVPPLKVISSFAVQCGDTEIAEGADALIRDLTEWFMFQGEMEVAPAVRNYNTAGSPENSCGIKAIAGVTDDAAKFHLTLFDTMMFREELQQYGERHRRCLELQSTGVYEKRVFDDKKAVTWMGKNAKLGTLTEFPLMPGCLQNPTWGVGWQSMPIVFVVRKENMGYLRWQVTSGDRRRCFPHETRHQHNNDNAALFTERWYPDMYTLAAQNENIAVVMRRINGLHNSARSITDEFAVGSFSGEAEILSVNGIDWAILHYPGKATVLLGALHGFTVHPAEEIVPRRPEEKLTSIMGIADDTGDFRRDPYRRPQKLTLGKSTGMRGTVKTDYLTVTQTLYEGEETRLDFRSLETSWAMIVLDRELDDAEAYLKTVEVRLESVADMEVYRLKDAMINRITLTAEGKTVTLTHDPYDRKSWN